MHRDPHAADEPSLAAAVACDAPAQSHATKVPIEKSSQQRLSKNKVRRNKSETNAFLLHATSAAYIRQRLHGEAFGLLLL